MEESEKIQDIVLRFIFWLQFHTFPINFMPLRTVNSLEIEQGSLLKFTVSKHATKFHSVSIHKLIKFIWFGEMFAALLICGKLQTISTRRNGRLFILVSHFKYVISVQASIFTGESKFQFNIYSRRDFLRRY